MLKTTTLENYNLSNTQIEFLRDSIKERKNILIAGDIRSGRTSFLNACLNELNNEDLRVVTIDDKDELYCPALNTTKGLINYEYSTEFLIQAYSKMRPDYMILGEMKTGKEIIEILKVWNSGHAGMTTIQAVDNGEKLYCFLKLSECMNKISDYERNIFPLLIGNTINIVVEIQDKKVQGIKEILGYNEQYKEYAYKTIN